MKLTEMKNPKRTFLLYGDSGTGKTCFASSFPGPLRVFDFDGKITSAASFHKGKDFLSEIEVSQYPLEAPSGQKRPFLKFIDDLNEFAKEQAEKQTYKTVLVDSFTTLLDQISHEEMKQRSSKSGRDSMLGVEVPNLKDYQIMNSFTKHLVQKILSINVQNIVFTAHIMQDKDETTGTILYTLQATPKISAWIPKLFQEVYRFHAKSEAGKIDHFIQTRADRKFVARSEIPKLPTNLKITNSDYKEIEKCL